MSLYFLTSNEKKANFAREDFSNIIDKGTIDEYEIGNMKLIISSGYKRKNLIRKIGENYVVVIGTIFSEELFNEELLNTFSTYEELECQLKEESQRIFGHFVVLFLDTKNKTIKVIPDRIGLINTYYSCDKDGDVFISNDIVEVSKVSQNTVLNTQAVYEFLMTESNIGKNTFFDKICRLGLGNSLEIKNNTIYETKFYDYTIHKISIDEYIGRIQKYFGMFNNYKGDVAVDLSAGYDTRLITAVANRQINNLKGFSQAIARNKGIDESIAKIISERLNIETYYFDEEILDVSKEMYNLVLHGTSMLRDVKRSIVWARLFSQKYKHCDLSIGGYGGEIVRAKYNKYLDVEEFVSHYYKGNEAEKICKFENYSNCVIKELEEYPIPSKMNLELLQNWYYTVAKMRIWGSGFIQISNLYGDVIHPFMDWYLLEPLFAFEKKDLKNAKLQNFIIDKFAPDLSDIPINKNVNQRNKVTFKDIVLKTMENNGLIRNVGNFLYCKVRAIVEYSNKYEDFPGLLCDNEKFEIKKILTKCGKRIANRMNSVIFAYKIVNKIR